MSHYNSPISRPRKYLPRLATFSSGESRRCSGRETIMEAARIKSGFEFRGGRPAILLSSYQIELASPPASNK